VLKALLSARQNKPSRMSKKKLTQIQCIEKNEALQSTKEVGQGTHFALWADFYLVGSVVPK
jgi:hypothetical protein